MLTFVVVGGGFAGHRDRRGALRPRARRLPLLPPRARGGAAFRARPLPRQRSFPSSRPSSATTRSSKLRARGLEFLLETRVAARRLTAILLDGAVPIPSRTVVWTAGNRPSPLVADLGARDATGPVPSSPTRRFASRAAKASGPSATVPRSPIPTTRARTTRRRPSTLSVRARSPPTTSPPRWPAASRSRSASARSVCSSHSATALPPQRSRGGASPGSAPGSCGAASTGSKLPGVEKKLRVLFDWAIDLAFPRDIVLTAPPPRRRDASRRPRRATHA